MNNKQNKKTTVSSSIEVTYEITKEIIEQYDGDYKLWSRENFSEYKEKRKFNIEYRKLYLDKIGALEDLEYEGYTINKDMIFKNRLKKSKVSKVKLSQMHPFEVDINLLAKVKNTTSVFEDREALNYIYLNKTDIIATDSTMMIYLKNHKFTHNMSILFPPYFIEPLLDGAKCFISDYGTLFLSYENNWYKGVNEDNRKKNNFQYPNVYSYLLNDEVDYSLRDDYEHIKFISLKNTKPTKSSTARWEILKINFKESSHLINFKYYKELLNLNLNITDVYAQKNNNSPIYFIGENFQIIIMPFLDDQ